MYCSIIVHRLNKVKSTQLIKSLRSLWYLLQYILPDRLFLRHETLKSYLCILLRDREFNRAVRCLLCLLSKQLLACKMAGEYLISYFYSLFLYCCGARVASEWQHNQGLRGIYLRFLEFITFYHNAFNLTRMHCATFYQSAFIASQTTPSCHTVEPSSFFAWIPVSQINHSSARTENHLSREGCS